MLHLLHNWALYTRFILALNIMSKVNLNISYIELLWFLKIPEHVLDFFRLFQ